MAFYLGEGGRSSKTCEKLLIIKERLYNGSDVFTGYEVPSTSQEIGWNRARGVPRGKCNNLQLRPCTHGENLSYNKRRAGTCVLCEDTAQ